MLLQNMQVLLLIPSFVMAPYYLVYTSCDVV